MYLVVLFFELTLNYITCISDTQTGFLKGIYRGETTRFTHDSMDYTDSENIPGLLVLIDFENAFDSMSWSYIYKVLQFFGLGNTIIDWVKILNNSVKAAVLQCGFLSNSLISKEGVDKETQ